ncbi:hypothetical protein [Scytonema sp. NUACC21]
MHLAIGRDQLAIANFGESSRENLGNPYRIGAKFLPPESVFGLIKLDCGLSNAVVSKLLRVKMQHDKETKI